MKVYILQQHLFDGSEIIGVYAKLQDAEGAQRSHENTQDNDYYYTITVWTLR